MAKVTGIGGVFFKSDDPDALYAWYTRHLGVPRAAWGPGTDYKWRHLDDPARIGRTVFSMFRRDSDYFAPSSAPFMINLRVDDLDALLAELRAAGLQVDPRIEESAAGRFGWVMDPDGNRVELWEPPASE